MSLLEHLRELRTRLIYSALAILVGTCITYSYCDLVFSILNAVFYENFKGGTLIGTGPAEAFLLKLKVAVFAGIILVSPFLFFQLWKFIEPALYQRERRLALPFIVSGTLLFTGGVWFCHRFVLPVSLGFFADQYQSIGVTPQVRVSEHLSIMMQALIGFGLVFELPVLAFFLARFGIITSAKMISASRYAIVGIFIISGILTPPDALTQLLMAGPLLVLYGISVVVVRFTETRRTQQPTEDHLLPDAAKSGKL
ncbi:MAG: twin-arginine translocase subunit TatC [Proteobacteria bacterium]|nr:twin-arginine translocase subunit TatC [Pseudomonadota bacterium]